MGRTPCCEKMGLKKGPWTPEEDKILITYIRQHGHTNWRALPKQAGLLRCGKSCRLRWTNYLRPDIKRGNFTPDEEETIIKLHEMLGNRWSTIAARLSGRTDNEIKNVWHTHLKKRLPKSISDSITATIGGLVVEPTRKRIRKPKETKKDMAHKKLKSQPVKYMNTKEENNNNNDDDVGAKRPPPSPISRDQVSPQPCTSQMSTVTSTSISASESDNFGNENVGGKGDYFGNFTEINDDFWMEVLSVEDTAMSTEDLSYVTRYDQDTSLDPLVIEPMFESSSMVNGDDMDCFWHNLLTRPSELPELSEML